MVRKSKKNEEYEQAMLDLYLFAKVLTDENFRRALIVEIEDTGHFMDDMLRVLQGIELERKWLDRGRNTDETH